MHSPRQSIEIEDPGVPTKHFKTGVAGGLAELRFASVLQSSSLQQ
jgi:hypothetical protein